MKRSATSRASALSPIALLVLAGAFAAPQPAAAQIPEEFTNLEVLPEDISRGELVGVMRGFAGALGVRCNYCHVGEDPNNLEGYDFASDEKEIKRVAREMMRMRSEINDNLLAATGRTDRIEVRCVTCHSGLARPLTLQDEMYAALESGGAAAADTRYRELRERYYGGAAYDFRQGPLNNVAETLAQRGELEHALAMITLNIEHNPEDAYPNMLHAQILFQMEDRDGAIAAVERALEIEPDNEFYKQQLERLKGG